MHPLSRQYHPAGRDHACYTSVPVRRMQLSGLLENNRWTRVAHLRLGKQTLDINSRGQICDGSLALLLSRDVAIQALFEPQLFKRHLQAS